MKTKSILIALVLCLLCSAAAFSQDEVQLTVSPRVLDIDAFYNGSTLTVSGVVPADSQAVLRFLGAACELNMKERGKVFGIMWMNLDSLIFKGVPSVCIVSSATDMESLSGGAKGDESPPLKALTLDGIKDSARIESKNLDRAMAFEELLKLKRGEGLYREMVGNVSYGHASDGKKSFQAEIPVPSRLSPGSYVVELAAVRNGDIIARTQQPVSANLIGFPALLSNLAFGHAALYGVLATIIAIFAGLAIGMVFQSKGAH